MGHENVIKSGKPALKIRELFLNMCKRTFSEKNVKFFCKIFYVPKDVFLFIWA